MSLAIAAVATTVVLRLLLRTSNSTVDCSPLAEPEASHPRLPSGEH